MFRAAIVLLLVVAVTASASEDYCTPPESSPEVTTPPTGVSLSGKSVNGENPGIYYVDNELCQFDGCAFSVWIYEETNGQEGLQAHPPFACDGCGCPPYEADTIVL